MSRLTVFDLVAACAAAAPLLLLTIGAKAMSGQLRCDMPADPSNGEPS